MSSLKVIVLFVQEDLYETIAQLESLHVITNSDESDLKSDLTKKRTNDKEKYFLFVSVLLRFAVKDKIFLRYRYFFKRFLISRSESKNHAAYHNQRSETGNDPQ